MKRIAFDEKNDSVQVTKKVRTDYRCAANGCPNMGGIGGGEGKCGVDRSGVCFFHYQAEPKNWDATTREILANPRMRDPVHRDPTIIPDKREHGPKAWAYALRSREESGESLTGAQRAMWRSALSHLSVEAA